MILEKNNELLKGWTQTSFDSIAEIKNGYAFKSSTYQKSGIPIVRISNIKNHVVSLDEHCVFVPNHMLKSNKDFKIYKNDILIALSGATTGKYGVYEFDTDALVNQRVGLIRSRNDKILFQKYMLYYFGTLQKLILKKAYGMAQPNVSTNFLKQLEIQLPPINEQKRIVGKIEEFFSKIDNYEKELSILEKKYLQLKYTISQNVLTGNLKQFSTESNSETRSIFNNFKNPQQKDLKRIEDNEIKKFPKLPKSWSWIRLGEICMIADVDHKMPKSIPNGIPFISTKDFQDDGTIDFVNSKKISKSSFMGNTKKVSPKIGDILFSRYGTLGKVIRVPDQQFGLSYSIAIIRPFFKEINFDWLYSLLESPFITYQAIKGDQSSAMADLGLITMRNFLVPLPPNLIQKHIADIFNNHISNLDKQSKEIQTHQKLSNRLRVSVLKQAFEGKLVPQDPNDDPVEILLKKI
jgi:type I restriction enzyme, S subunit